MLGSLRWTIEQVDGTWIDAGRAGLPLCGASEHLARSCCMYF